MKILMRLFLGLVLVSLISASVGAAMFWYNWEKDLPASVKETEVTPKSLYLGEAVKVRIFIKTPWYRKIENPPELTGRDDVSLTAKVKIEKTVTWSGNMWQIEVEAVPFAAGKIDNLALRIPLSLDRQKKQRELLVNLPEFEVKAAGFKSKDVVNLKGKLGDEDLIKKENSAKVEKSWRWIYLAVILLLIVLLIIYLSWRKKSVKVLTIWEKSLQQLEELRKKKELRDDLFFVMLTDIVRQYIEGRFRLPATEKTSEEFIAELRNEQQLSELQRAALRKFLEVADLVKFAKFSTSEVEREESILVAERFIKETIPVEREALR